MPRIPELDSLRGLAAIGVLALHTLHRYFFWAWSCVDLFFVLSGFLISSILLANRDAPGMLIAFYARRALRIWPVYYLTWLFASAIALALALHDGGAMGLPDGHWMSLIFLQYVENYLPAAQARDYLWYFSHSWSLAVEEQFYLLWPLLFIWLRPRAPLLTLLGLVLLTGALVLRGVGESFHVLATRVDGLLFGILLAFLVHFRLLKKVPLVAFVLVIGVSAALLVPYVLSHGKASLIGIGNGRAVEVLAFCLLYAAIVGVCVQRSGARWLAPLRLAPLTHLGQLSFAIYMYQVPIGCLVLLAVEAQWISPVLGDGLIWVATLAAAQLSYMTVEKRMLALKRYFPYRPRAARESA